MPSLARLATALVLASAAAGASAHAGHAHDPKPAQARAPETPSAPLAVSLPDVTVTDQHGQRRRITGDLVRGRTTLVHFFFTGCTSICSPLTTIVKAARDTLAARGHTDVQVLSISVDPLNDTPERLADYARRLGVGGDGWHLVSGSRTATDALLRAFGLPLGGRLDDHTPMVFVGEDGGRRWTRAYGLAGPQAIVDRVAPPPAARPAATGSTGTPGSPAADPLPPALRAEIARQAAAAQPARLGDRDAAAYFTNLPLVAHDRGRVRFYDDLLKGRVVMINAFFADCRDVCSPITFNLARAQQRLAATPGLGPVHIVSLSVDPVADTPEVLAAYARRHGAGPGWSFVTGKKENVDWVLHKLGLYVPEKEEHQAALWIGDDRTNTWLKLHALATPEAIVAAVRKVVAP